MVESSPEAKAVINEDTQETPVMADATPSTSPTTEEGMMPEGTKGAVKEFTVVGDDFAFDTKEIKVNKGDTVRITFENKEGFHDWVIDEFKAKTKQIKAGEKETIEFIADKAGTFEYYCSVGQHRKMGMKGNLIVQ